VATPQLESPTVETPQFSIFIPAWNGSQWLAKAIKSVVSQDYDHWEVIVADNASSDDLQSIVAGFEDPRVRYHRWADHTDLYENFNRSVGLCSYRWIQPLGIDDQLRPGCLRKMAQRIEEMESRGVHLGAVITAARHVDPQGNLADSRFFGANGRREMVDGLYDGRRWLLSETERGWPPWITGTIAIPREVIGEIGGLFRPEIGAAGEIELALRVSAYGDIAYIAEELLDYTVTEESDGNGRSAMDRSSGFLVPTTAAALMSGLHVHEYRRSVSDQERRQVHRAIAHAFLRRAAQHRYRPGGRGRLYSLRDLIGVVRYDPSRLLSPPQLVFAMMILLAPSNLIAKLLRNPPKIPFLGPSLGIVLRDSDS
jgi:glycosyltransferase involved in cell wall biosynthesis